MTWSPMDSRCTRLPWMWASHGLLVVDDDDALIQSPLDSHGCAFPWTPGGSPTPLPVRSPGPRPFWTFLGTVFVHTRWPHAPPQNAPVRRPIWIFLVTSLPPQQQPSGWSPVPVQIFVFGNCRPHIPTPEMPSVTRQIWIVLDAAAVELAPLSHPSHLDSFGCRRC